MSKNIRIEYKNGIANRYITQSTEDLHLPSLSFSTEEEALLFRKYLDTDLAMFFLKLVKRDCVLYNHLGEVPYIRDEETFISSIEGYSKEKVLSYITEETKGYGFKYKKV